jgi:putative colanic acid biosynthesis UDP-glucose lipid carrier transferase
MTCLFLLKLESECFFRNFILIYYLSTYTIFIIWRIIAREMLKWNRKRGKNFRRIIIVGAGKNGLALFSEMKKETSYGYNILGFFDDNRTLKNTLPNYLGMTHEVEDFAIEHNVDEIYCALPNSQDEKIIRILNFTEKNMIRFYIVPEFSRYVKRKLDLENIESVPIMAVRSEPLQSPVNRFIKRTFDILFSITFLILIFPFFYLIIGTIIKMSSNGPIFFKQKRTGIYGKNFYCYKFRTMRPNRTANEKQAEKNDPRITRTGNFLRHYNLDEIPQFYNVLKGDMSVVGPRPHMLKHTELYSSIIDKYMVRHLIKPGITGWAQVNGYRGETRTTDQMEARVRYDVWYLENWSFLLDLKIIIVTIFNMFKGEKNAY